MELHWSHASTGKYGAAGEGFPIGDSRTITQTLERNPEDDFECTYFRQPTIRTPAKAKKGDGLFPITISYKLSSELSDGYTDSDSESDSTSNVERWLESLPTNDAWSSAPNYSALDGSEGLEGADEIQEDIKKDPENDLTSCPNGTNDSRRNLTGSELVRRPSGNRDEISVMTEWLDRQKPRKNVERTLRNRKKIALSTKLEREARAVIENEKLRTREANIPKRNVSFNKTGTWSESNTLEATESRTAIKKLSTEEDGYDETMQEMVNRLLTVSAHREDESTNDKTDGKSKNKPSSVINCLGDSKKLCVSKESEETVDSSLPQLARKKARLSAPFNKLSAKLPKSKINESRVLKSKQVARKLPTIKKRTPKGTRKISQERNLSFADTKHQLKPVQRTRYAFRSGPFVENISSRKKTTQYRTVRFKDEVTTWTSSEAWREAAVLKAARNKQILQTVEQIVDNIKSEEFNVCTKSDEAQRIPPDAVSEPETRDAVEAKQCGLRRSDRKRPMHSIEEKTVGGKKPMFTNPFVENCLDKAMELALSKYKHPKNTWADFVRQKSRENKSSTVYEPPTKKLKPKCLTSKLKNMSCQDFSLFSSWQSIHNYFLLHSSCK